MKKLFSIFAAWVMGVSLAVASEIGDNGLHIQPWFRDTFKDLREDLAEANAEGKRLVLFFEQRGCFTISNIFNNYCWIPR